MNSGTGSLEELAQTIRSLADGFLVVTTGAGISLASGIPTFRGTDPDAVWKRDVMELATNAYFLEDPVGSWHWYLSRFGNLLGKRPNPAHKALVALERWHEDRGGTFLLISQNVDTLHEQAGSKQLVKVHGRADRVRCSRVGCPNGAPQGTLTRDPEAEAAFMANPCEATIPRCPACGSYLRQHVLLFDERYDSHEDYEWDRVVRAAFAADMHLFVGTSFSVGVTDLLLGSALQLGRPAFLIDPGLRPPPGVVLIRQPAEEALPALLTMLGIAP